MIQETQAQISDRLVARFQATPPFNSVNLSPSAVAMWRKFIDVIAAEIWVLEQLNNTFEAEIETIINKVTTPTDLWWQVQIKKFQYNAAIPQVAILDEDSFSPYYNPVVPSYRIISNCAVVTAANNIVQVKVTNNGAVLDAFQLLALKAYIKTIAPAGVASTIINELPDRLSMAAEIFYNGSYSSVISATVIAALDNYLNNIPFNGLVKVSELEDAIQSVPGVTDVVITSVWARKNVTPFASRVLLARLWQTYSGQIIQEDTAGATFADTLTFTISNS